MTEIHKERRALTEAETGIRQLQATERGLMETIRSWKTQRGTLFSSPWRQDPSPKVLLF